MRITTALLVSLLCALPVQAAVQHSSDFGWAAGEDVTEDLAKLLDSGKLKAGDELVLDHTYRISGTHELPDDFTSPQRRAPGSRSPTQRPTANHCWSSATEPRCKTSRSST